MQNWKWGCWLCNTTCHGEDKFYQTTLKLYDSTVVQQSVRTFSYSFDTTVHTVFFTSIRIPSKMTVALLFFVPTSIIDNHHSSNIQYSKNSILHHSRVCPAVNVQWFTGVLRVHQTIIIMSSSVVLFILGLTVSWSFHSSTVWYRRRRSIHTGYFVIKTRSLKLIGPFLSVGSVNKILSCRSCAFFVVRVRYFSPTVLHIRSVYHDLWDFFACNVTITHPTTSTIFAIANLALQATTNSEPSSCHATGIQHEPQHSQQDSRGWGRRL